MISNNDIDPDAMDVTLTVNGTDVSASLEHGRPDEIPPGMDRSNPHQEPFTVTVTVGDSDPVTFPYWVGQGALGQVGAAQALQNVLDDALSIYHSVDDGRRQEWGGVPPHPDDVGISQLLDGPISQAYGEFSERFAYDDASEGLAAFCGCLRSAHVLADAGLEYDDTHELADHLRH